MKQRDCVATSCEYRDAKVWKVAHVVGLSTGMDDGCKDFASRSDVVNRVNAYAPKRVLPTVK